MAQQPHIVGYARTVVGTGNANFVPSRQVSQAPGVQAQTLHGSVHVVQNVSVPNIQGLAGQPQGMPHGAQLAHGGHPPAAVQASTLGTAARSMPPNVGPATYGTGVQVGQVGAGATSPFGSPAVASTIDSATMQGQAANVPNLSGANGLIEAPHANVVKPSGAVPTRSLPSGQRSQSYEPPQTENTPDTANENPISDSNREQTKLEKQLIVKSTELAASIDKKAQTIKDLQMRLKASHAAKVVMALVDTNGHRGQVTKTQIQSHLYNTDYEDFAHWLLNDKQFIKMDDTHSGTIDRPELMRAFEQFYSHPAEVRSYAGRRSVSRGRRSLVDAGTTTLIPGTMGRRGSDPDAPVLKPTKKYKVVAKDDPVDRRLEEFYNSTGSAIPFKRVNCGFYKFGETTVELKIVNNKLMAQTEDDWNRGKFGPIEKFMMHFESQEREKAGIPVEEE